MNEAQLTSLFTYHAPHGDQAKRYERLRAGGRRLAELVNELAPESGEKTLAIRRVQEAVMYANAAIACNEPKPATRMSDGSFRCNECAKPIAAGETVFSTGDGSYLHERCYACAR